MDKLNEALSYDWHFDTCYEKENNQVRVGDEGVLVELLTTWGRHKPAAFDYSKEEIDKITMIMLNANKLYNLVSGIDSDEARAMIHKIDSGNPENYRKLK